MTYIRFQKSLNSLPDQVSCLQTVCVEIKDVYCSVGLAFSEVRRRCPIHKYFSLYRWDPVTESNVPGGHIRIAFRCNNRSEYFDGDAMEHRSTSSMDRLSLCSFGPSERLSLTHSCDSDIHALPQRPVSAISHVVYCSSTQPVSVIHEQKGRNMMVYCPVDSYKLFNLF